MWLMATGWRDRDGWGGGLDWIGYGENPGMASFFCIHALRAGLVRECVSGGSSGAW